MSLAQLKKSNSLDKLLGAVQKKMPPKKKSPMWMNVCGSQNLIRQVMVMQ